MCDPVTWAYVGAVVIGAVSAGVNYSGQQAAAKQNKINAREAFAQNIEAIQAQNAEQAQANAEDALNVGLQGAQERSAANAFAMGVGLSGSSTRSLAQQAGFGSGRSLALLEADRKAQEAQSARALSGANVNLRADISRVQDPSALGLGLQIVGGAAQTYTGYKSATTPKH